MVVDQRLVDPLLPGEGSGRHRPDPLVAHHREGRVQQRLLGLRAAHRPTVARIDGGPSLPPPAGPTDLGPPPKASTTSCTTATTPGSRSADRSPEAAAASARCRCRPRRSGRGRRWRGPRPTASSGAARTAPRVIVVPLRPAPSEPGLLVGVGEGDTEDDGAPGHGQQRPRPGERREAGQQRHGARLHRVGQVGVRPGGDQSLRRVPRPGRAPPLKIMSERSVSLGSPRPTSRVDTPAAHLHWRGDRCPSPHPLQSRRGLGVGHPGGQRRHHPDRRPGAADRLGSGLPDLASLHDRLVRAALRAGCARGHRVLQPDAHLRAHRRRRGHVRRRLAVGRLDPVAAVARGADRGRRPPPGGHRRHQRSDPSEPVGGRPAPRALDGPGRRLDVAAAARARHGPACRGCSERGAGRPPARRRDVRGHLGRRLARHGGHRQRPARR